MAVRDQRASLTAGGLGSFNGWSDQKLRRSAAIVYLPLMGAAAVDGEACGHVAPSFTHAMRSSTSASFSLPPMGIFRLGSLCRTARINRLLPGSPGTRAAPDLPPLSIASRLSRRKPPSCELV